MPRPGRRRKAARRAGAKTGEDEKNCQDKGDRIERVPEEQDEALDDGDLDEQERQTKAKKIKPDRRAAARIADLAAQESERQHNERHTQSSGLNDRCHEDQVTPFDERHGALRAQRQKFRQRTPPKKVEKIWSSIGRRP